MCLPGLSGQEALERAEAGSGQERPALTQPGPETGEREELVTSEHSEYSISHQAPHKGDQRVVSGHQHPMMRGMVSDVTL